MPEHHDGVWGGLIVGAVLGAGLALLLAPASGRKTRTRIVRRLGQWRDSTDDRFDETRDAWREAARQLADALQAGVDVFRATAAETAAKRAGPG